MPIDSPQSKTTERKRDMKAKTVPVLAPKNPFSLPDNPKDLVGQTKLDLSLIPETFLIELALAFYEGALKYGRFNWRMRPVKASVYLSAFDRHIIKYKSGEDCDKLTGTHHFGYAACCIAILFDAKKYGTLVDDRAPRGRLNPDISKWLDGEVMKRVAKLKDIFRNEKPRQFTIQDNILDDMRELRDSQRRSTVRRKKGRSHKAQ